MIKQEEEERKAQEAEKKKAKNGSKVEEAKEKEDVAAVEVADETPQKKDKKENKKAEDGVVAGENPLLAALLNSCGSSGCSSSPSGRVLSFDPRPMESERRSLTSTCARSRRAR